MIDGIPKVRSRPNHARKPGANTPSRTRYRRSICRCGGCGATVLLETIIVLDQIGPRCFCCRSKIAAGRRFA